MSRYAKKLTKVEEVSSGLREYVPEEDSFISESRKNEKLKLHNPPRYGPTKQEAEAHEPLRNEALKELEEESIKLGELHLKDAHEYHLQKRTETLDKLKQLSLPAVIPNKPRVQKDFTLNGVQVLIIGGAIIVIALLIKKFILKKSLP